MSYIICNNPEKCLLYIDEINLLIKSSPDLTTRALPYLKKMLSLGRLFICLEKDILCGFCITEPVTNSYVELKSLFVKPEYRNKGVASFISNTALSQKDKVYYAFTFNSGAEEFFKKKGFKKAAVTSLPGKVLFMIFLSRPFATYKRLPKNTVSLYIKEPEY